MDAGERGLLFRFLWFILTLLIALCLLVLPGVGCTGLVEGDASRTLQQAADLPAPPVKASEPAMAQRFDPAHGTLTGYRPRKVLPNGDATGGHFVDITITNTLPEVITPSAHIPRAPKTVTQPLTKIRQPKPPLAEAPPPTDVPAALAPLLPPPNPGVSINPHTGDLNGVVVAPR